MRVLRQQPREVMDGKGSSTCLQGRVSQPMVSANSLLINAILGEVEVLVEMQHTYPDECSHFR